MNTKNPLQPPNEIELNAMKSGIPDHMISDIVRYLGDGILPGAFLKAVINNDLKHACNTSDTINIHCLVKYVNFFYCHAHPASWGYPEATQKWPEILKRSRS